MQRSAGRTRARHSADGTPVDYTAQPTMPSGGGGMVSTAEDYYRFAQMLANGGELERQAHPRSIHRQADDFEPRACQPAHGRIRHRHVSHSAGLRLGLRLRRRLRSAEANLPDGKGTFFWDGAAGTWFWVDPTNDIVFVGMIQRMSSPDNHPLEYKSHAVIDQALVDPAK